MVYGICSMQHRYPAMFNKSCRISGTEGSWGGGGGGGGLIPILIDKSM